MAFVEPAYRGRGLSRLLFEACLAWTKAQPFRRAVVAHRASNTVAKRMICRFGFQPTSRSLRTWPDGTTDDEIGYELVLRE